MKALPAAQAMPNIHIGIIAGKLNGVIPATTPDQLQQVQTLPAGQVTRLNRNGTDYYIFPDRTQKQLYVGQLAQYEDYLRRRDIERNAALDNAAEQESLQEARTDSSIQWNNAWGSWTGH